MMKMFMDMLQPAMIGSAVRAILAAFSGVVVSSGFGTGEEWGVVVGGFAMLATLIWSFIAKKRQEVI